MCVFSFGSRDSLKHSCTKIDACWDKETPGANQSSQGIYAAVAAAKSPQSCLTLCDPIDGSPPGSPIPGILQARILEWVAISFSNA